MLRLVATAAAASVPTPRLVCCRRCLSAAAAATTAAPRRLLIGYRPHPRLHSPVGTRGYITLSSLRDWFAEGPVAAAPPLTPPPPPPPSLPPPIDESSASSFFVQDAPAAIQELLEGSAAEQLLGAAVGEATFASLGLGTGFWPSSFQLKVLETLHVTLDAPWWLCALAMGVGVRLILLLPNMQLQRMMRCDAPRLSGLQEFKERFDLAIRSSNMPEMFNLRQRALEQFGDMSSPLAYRKFYRRMLLTILGQFGGMVFVQLASIRAIYLATALPVESFQRGGMLWVTDLTCIDPYFLLPTAVTGLLMLNVHQFFKNAAVGNAQMQSVRPLAYTLLPAFVFTFMVNFPGANLFYFLATGCTAHLIHLANSTQAGKAFWKARIGLPFPEETPPALSSPHSRLTSDRIRTKIMPALNNQDYQATRLPEGLAPKTFRIRQKQRAAS